MKSFYAKALLGILFAAVAGIALSAPVVGPGTLTGGQYLASPPTLADGQQSVTMVDNLGNTKVSGTVGVSGGSVGLLAGTSNVGNVGVLNVPINATQLSASSGNVAAGVATATLTGQAAKSTYITGFQITFGGATAALCVTATVTGTLATAPSYVVCAPAGVAVQGTPLVVTFPQPLISSAQNTNIVVSLPSLGAGNTNTVVNAQGYVQ